MNKKQHVWCAKLFKECFKTLKIIFLWLFNCKSSLISVFFKNIVFKMSKFFHNILFPVQPQKILPFDFKLTRSPLNFMRDWFIIWCFWQSSTWRLQEFLLASFLLSLVDSLWLSRLSSANKWISAVNLLLFYASLVARSRTFQCANKLNVW